MEIAVIVTKSLNPKLQYTAIMTFLFWPVDKSIDTFRKRSNSFGTNSFFSPFLLCQNITHCPSNTSQSWHFSVFLIGNWQISCDAMLECTFPPNCTLYSYSSQLLHISYIYLFSTSRSLYDFKGNTNNTLTAKPSQSQRHFDFEDLML